MGNKEHIERLENLGRSAAASELDARSILVAIELMRAAEPKDEREEAAVVSRAAYRVADAGTEHACDVARMVKEERAQARAEGYAQAQGEADRLEAMALEFKAKLRTAQAEITLKHAAFVAEGTARDALETKLTTAQAEIERLKAESEAWKENAEEHRKHGDNVCAQRVELLAENERLSAEYQHVDAELGVFKTTAQALNGRINELERQATRLRGSRDALKDQPGAQLDALETKLTNLRARDRKSVV